MQRGGQGCGHRKLHFDSGECRSGATEPAARKPQDPSRSSPSDRSSLVSTGRRYARRVLGLVERLMRSALKIRERSMSRRLGGKNASGFAENAENRGNIREDIGGTRWTTANRSAKSRDRHQPADVQKLQTACQQVAMFATLGKNAFLEKSMSREFTTGVKMFSPFSRIFIKVVKARKVCPGRTPNSWRRRFTDPSLAPLQILCLRLDGNH
jgi:hypothetical protein